MRPRLLQISTPILPPLGIEFSKKIFSGCPRHNNYLYLPMLNFNPIRLVVSAVR